MSVRLNIKVNGENLDLPPGIDATFFVTKQIHDILKGLSTREGDFTRAIALPNTAKNQSLTNAIVPINFNRVENDLIPCTVLMDGITVIDDGKLLVSKTSEHVINCNIFGGNTNFFSQLKDDPLSALQLSAYNFEFTPAGVTPIINASTGAVFANCLFTNNHSYREFFDLADGETIGTEYINFQWSGFWFYIDTLLDEIFKQLDGLTVDRSALDNQFRKNAIAITLPQFLEAYKLPPGYRGFGSKDVAQNFPNGITNLIPIDFDDPTGLWLSPNWIIQEPGLCVIRAVFNGAGSTPDVLTRPTMEVLHNGTIIADVTLNVGWNTWAQFEASILTSVTAKAGDAILVRVQNTNSSILDSVYFSHSVEREGANTSTAINVADYMPEISQKAFVLGCLKLYNIVANEKNGVILLTYWDDILTKPPALITDFANDAREGSTLTPAYGQRNYLKYADNDLILRTDTTGNFNVNSNYLNEEKTVIDVLFSASDNNEAPLNNANIVALPHYIYSYLKIENNKMNINGAGVYSTVDANGLKAGDIFQIIGAGDRFQVATVTDSKTGTVVTPIQIHNAKDWQFIHVEATGTDGINIASMEDETGLLTYGDGAEVGQIGTVFTPEYVAFDSVDYGDDETASLFHTVTSPIGIIAQGDKFQTDSSLYPSTYTASIVNANYIEAVTDFNGNAAGQLNTVDPNPGNPFKKAVFADVLKFEFILSNYFERFQAVIVSPAIVYAWLHVSVIDFVGLDQTAPIYIKSLAQYFYINKIEQFKTEGLTRFELIKI